MAIRTFRKGNAVVNAELMGNEVMVVSTVKGVEAASVICSIDEWITRLEMLTSIGFKEVVKNEKVSAPKKSAEERKTEKYGDLEHRRHFIEVRNMTCCASGHYFDEKAKAAGKYNPRDPEYKKQRKAFINAWANRVIAAEA